MLSQYQRKVVRKHSRRKRAKALKKARKKHRLTRHHMTPKSRGGTTALYNILVLKEERHNALHRVFGVLTWHEIEVALRLKKILCNKDDWMLLFGSKTQHEAAELVERIARMKGYDRETCTNRRTG